VAFEEAQRLVVLDGMQRSGDKAALFDWITVFLEIEISFLIFERALSSYALIGGYVFQNPNSCKIEPHVCPFPKVHPSYHAKKLMALHSKATHNS
jgi:hypothetical protein